MTMDEQFLHIRDTRLILKISFVSTNRLFVCYDVTTALNFSRVFASQPASTVLDLVSKLAGLLDSVYRHGLHFTIATAIITEGNTNMCGWDGAGWWSSRSLGWKGLHGWHLLADGWAGWLHMDGRGRWYTGHSFRIACLLIALSLCGCGVAR